MYTPNMSNRIDILERVPYWAADTGCYSATTSREFDLTAYLKWLEERTCHQQRCLFATAPDIVGDAQATWRRSVDVLPQLRAVGYRAALVAQDGMESMPIEWAAFDCLFVGGTTEWKLSEAAYEIAREAKACGKWLHMGRVNSRRRLVAAAVSGYDSADGTYVAFGPDKNLPKLVSWLDELRVQQRFIA